MSKEQNSWRNAKLEELGNESFVKHSIEPEWMWPGKYEHEESVFPRLKYSSCAWAIFHPL
jgi:hypothetical protein